MNENLGYTKFEIIPLNKSGMLRESEIEEIIKQDPSILNLGDLRVIQYQKRQPTGGILDLLLENEDSGVIYVVELQRGKTDPSHIIRTIEYWDNEKKRYPKNNYVAVLIAEEITSRFFNVISIFNRFIPIIAINLTAVKHNNEYGLIFTKVLDNSNFIPEEENLDVSNTTTEYETKWKEMGTYNLVLKLFKVIQSFEKEIKLTYLKYYIGLKKNDKPMNFVSFVPRKNNLQLEIRLDFNTEKEDELNSFLDYRRYDDYFRKYIVILNEQDIEANIDYLKKVINEAYQFYMET